MCENNDPEAIFKTFSKSLDARASDAVPSISADEAPITIIFLHFIPIALFLCVYRPCDIAIPAGAIARHIIESPIYDIDFLKIVCLAKLRGQPILKTIFLLLGRHEIVVASRKMHQ